MNVNPFSKKSATVAKPVKGVSPLNDIGDVSAVTEMFQRLRQQNAQYDQAITALVAANRIKDGWDKPAEPEMTLTIQREVLVALGDTGALAKFDQQHQQTLAQEQARAMTLPENEMGSVGLRRICHLDLCHSFCFLLVKIHL